MGPPPDVARRPNYELLLIGSSTGGPPALRTLIEGFGRRLSVPAAIVQHMPGDFTGLMAKRLDQAGALNVFESKGVETLLPGDVAVAPGDSHLEVRPAGAGWRTRLLDTPEVCFCRPSVDVLFQGAVRRVAPPRRVLAVVLTGMGHDGLEGARAIRAAGGTVFVQDEASSVVWGMPGAIANAGEADAVLPLERMADAVLAELRRPSRVVR